MQPFWQADALRLYVGEMRAVLAALEPGCVQTVVTSPPYYQTRSYGTDPQVWAGAPVFGDAWRICAHTWEERRTYLAGASAIRRAADAHAPAGSAHAAAVRASRWTEDRFCTRCGAEEVELGRESDPRRYVAHIVACMEAVRRVLRDDGTVWLNLGDCYAGSGYSNHKGTGGARREAGGRQRHVRAPGFRTKSLLGVPWRVAIALQDAGWLLRQCVTWSKPGTQPQPSARDRPWTTHEYVFLLTRQGRYFYRQAEGGMPRSSVWTAPVGRRSGHNAAMQQSIAEIAIRLATRPGDVVLDPFAGSGTTLAAARALGRAGIGVEVSRPAAENAARLLTEER